MHPLTKEVAFVTTIVNLPEDGELNLPSA